MIVISLAAAVAACSLLACAFYLKKLHTEAVILNYLAGEVRSESKRPPKL